MKLAIECFDCGDTDEDGGTQPTYTWLATTDGSEIAIADVEAVCGQCRSGRARAVRVREPGDLPRQR